MDRQTQTMQYTSEDEETMEGMMTEGDEKNDNAKPNNVTIIYHQKQKIKMFEQRLSRLQELLAESENQHKRKNIHMEEMKMSAMKSDSKTSKNAEPWNHSEYLKNPLMQYFDAKITIHQLLAVVSVGLSLDEEEQEKAKN